MELDIQRDSGWCQARGRGREGQVSRARRDVVYATSMIGRAALGATAARKPLVIKLTTDEAYERAQRRGLRRRPGRVPACGRRCPHPRLRRSRDAALRQATRVVCPSAYLRDIAVSWGVPPARPGDPEPGARPAAAADARRGARRSSASMGRRIAFAGRIGRQKSLRWAWRRWRGWQASATRRGRWARAGGDGALAPDAVRFLGRCRATTCSASSVRPTRASSPRPGRTSRTRWSSRSPSAPPSSRRASVAFPRSCRTAKTGCSWLRVTRALSRRPSTASTANAACASGWAPPPRSRWPATDGRDARAHRGCARGGGGMRKLLMVGRALPAAAVRQPCSEVLRAARRSRRARRRFVGRRLARRRHVQPLATAAGARRCRVLRHASFRVTRELRRFRPDAVTAQSPMRHLRCSRPAASCARAPRSSSSSTATGARSRASTARRFAARCRR